MQYSLPPPRIGTYWLIDRLDFSIQVRTTPPFLEGAFDIALQLSQNGNQLADTTFTGAITGSRFLWQPILLFTNPYYYPGDILQLDLYARADADVSNKTSLQTRMYVDGDILTADNRRVLISPN